MAQKMPSSITDLLTTHHSTFCENYIGYKYLGKGGFGTVFEATERYSDCRVAIKRVKLKGDQTDEKVLRELKVLSELDHADVLRYHHSWTESIEDHKKCEEKFLGTSYISGSSSSHMKRNAYGNANIRSSFTNSFSDESVVVASSLQQNQLSENTSKSSGIATADQTEESQGYHHSSTEPTEDHEKCEEKSFSASDINGSSSSKMTTTSYDNANIQSSFTNSVSDEGIVFASSSQENQLSQDISKSSGIGTADQTEEKQEEISKSQKSPMYLFIVTGLCMDKSLNERLVNEYRSNNKIDRIDALHIFYQIVNGVTYLHNVKDLIHCDLKPGNILFSLDGNTVKIADFGLALKRQNLTQIEDRCKSNKTGKFVGTPTYMPPNTETISDKTDIYALGIILFELLYPFSTFSERKKVLENIRKADIIFPNDFEKYGNELLIKLISRLLSHSSNKRPTANDLNENIQRDIGAVDFIRLNGKKLQKTLNTNKNATVPKIENVLNSPVVKQLNLATDEIQHGVYDTSDQYLLLSDDQKLKLYNIDCTLIDEYSGLHDHFKRVGSVQRIVWCQSLKQFFILCGKFLYTFSPSETTKLMDMKKVLNIKPYDAFDKLRFIACTNDHIFLNRSYCIIEQYDIPTWYCNRKWSKEVLNYDAKDEIRRITCSTTDDYIAFKVRLDDRTWVIDFRCINSDLTLLKRVEKSDVGIYHNVQLSSYEWLLRDEKNKFYVLNILEEECKPKTIQTSITSERHIYTRFFGNYFIVPIVVSKVTEDEHNRNREYQGIICFYQWE